MIIFAYAIEGTHNHGIRIRKSAILIQNKPMETNRELDIARYIVEKTTDNLFLTGKAGTGKTTFLRDIKRYTKKNTLSLHQPE